MTVDQNIDSSDLIDAAAIIVLVLDDHGRINKINRYMSELTGYSQKEVAGKNWFSTFIPGHTQANVKNVFKTAIKNGDTNGNINPILDKNGNEITVKWYNRTIKGADADITGLLCIGLDISNQVTLEKEIEGRDKALISSLESTINSLSEAIGARDPYTQGHQKTVAILSDMIASHMGLDENQRTGIRLGAEVHDIGKIGIPLEILVKPGKLNDSEFSIIQLHPQTGYKLLEKVEYPWPIAKIVLQHHERLDGTGYPQGLTEDEICIEARIVAVADVIDAICSHRPYRPGKGIGFAIDEVKRGKSLRYDPNVVDAVIDLFEKGELEKILGIPKGIEFLATHDPLTGVLNRWSLDSRLEDEVSRASRYQRNFSIMFLDIDDFKLINDKFGHQTGDLALIRFTKQLNKFFRDSDFCGRYGGEEFIVGLPETAPTEALELAQRLINHLKHYVVQTDNGNSFQLSASIGIASLALHADTSKGLIDCADRAMYQAKNQGKNNVVLHSS